MSSPHQKWIRPLLSSSLVRPPPPNLHQKEMEILAYVELFAQFASESFGHDANELIRSHYPHVEASLLDDVLAVFILQYPEHGHAILHALLSCILDGSIIYDKKVPPFGSFISLFSPSSERDVSEQWALACGEILRVLTHYNRPVSKVESPHDTSSASGSSNHEASPSKGFHPHQDLERKTLTRLLTPWITDSLLAAPLGVKSDYFRWCGGVMGKYAAGGELKPPTTVGSKGPGKHPQLMPSTPRWAVANGAAVILSVCDDEVLRYETADLTAAAVPALLLPPPATARDDHLIAGLPPLEPFARLFHRYYAIATPGATQRLFLGLLEAPPSWAPDALDAAVQLVELLRAAEDYTAAMRLPRNWLHLHFLRPVGAALAMRSGIAAEAAAALLFRVFSQPALLFPSPGHAQDLQGKSSSGVSNQSSVRKQAVIAAAKATEEATARGIASLMCNHGPDVELQICTLWEAAYGLLPSNSATSNLPELVVATLLQPPILSWSLFRPLLRVLEYLPTGSPSEACLLRIFTTTVEMILQRAIPSEESHDTQSKVCRGFPFGISAKFAVKQVASTELRAMVHSLFTETCLPADLAARLLSVAFTVCLSHDAVQQSYKKTGKYFLNNESWHLSRSPSDADYMISDASEKRGAVATFDSYVVAAVCALACEVRLSALPAPLLGTSKQHLFDPQRPGVGNSASLTSLHVGLTSAVNNARRLLRLLEALLSLVPQSSYVVPGSGGTSSVEVVASAVVAAHISDVLGKSKACMQALAAIRTCSWEQKLASKASSVLNLVEGNQEVVAAVADCRHPHYTHEGKEPQVLGKRGQDYGTALDLKETIQKVQACHSHEDEVDTCHDHVDKKAVKICHEKAHTESPMNASDVVSLLCMDKDTISNSNIGISITKVLKENKDLSIAAVPLLCKRLITAPEIPPNGEGTSARRGWRQVVEALCTLVTLYPEKAAVAVMFQVEKELRPWTPNDDAPGFANVWQANKRIVCLLSELLRIHHVPEAVNIIAAHSNTLALATEGLAVDGEACTLPQLELLEAITLTTQHLICSNNPAFLSFSLLLKKRLPAIVHCLSHASAHVRALSVALLQNEAYSNLASGDHHTDNANAEWKKVSIAKCVAEEMVSLQASGKPVSMLTEATESLGCCIRA